MLPANAKIVECPYCGKEKELMCLASGNTFGAEQWSDAKFIAPMLPQVSPIQKCQQCGKYYPEYLLKSREGDECSFETGKLSYQEWKEAYEQFCAERIPEKYLNNVRFWILQSYNDYYYRENNGQVPSAEEFEFVKSVAIKFIEEHVGGVNPLMKAEIYREINEMQKCSETLSSITPELFNDFEMKIYCGIKERMEKGDNKVFRIE